VWPGLQLPQFVTHEEGRYAARGSPQRGEMAGQV
jgi:hypothetical protein